MRPRRCDDPALAAGLGSDSTSAARQSRVVRRASATAAEAGRDSSLPAMRCPACGASDDRVIDSREAEDGSAVRRRRECARCRARFSTVERLAGPTPFSVLKRSGEREPFSLAKLTAGIAAACKSTSVSEDVVLGLAGEVEEAVRRHGAAATSDQIGVAVLDRLRDLDEVAYLRFVSVYKGFATAGDFAREAGLLRKHTEPKHHQGADARLPAGPAGSHSER